MMRADVPLSWFVDPAVAAVERREVLDRAPRYVGSEAMVPAPGDYRVVDGTDGAEVLVRDSAGTPAVLGNVCRHRQATLLDGTGRVDRIHCPLHAWTYGLDGKLRTASRFDRPPDDHDLPRQEVESWQGLFFTGPRRMGDDLDGLALAPLLDVRGMRLDRVVVDQYDGNWKTFLEVYTELYHVAPFHPGLGRISDCGEVQWQFGAHWNCVGVGLAQKRAGSPAYERWQAAIRRQEARRGPPPFGAVWMVHYAGLMLEYYPYTVVVSNVVPDGPDRFVNTVEFYYPSDLDDPDFAPAQQAAYLETAAEDMEIIRRMTAGRRALAKRGLDDRGAIQPELERGLPHYYAWLRRELGPHLDG